MSYESPGHLASEVEKKQRQVSELKNRVADADNGVMCAEERNSGALWAFCMNNAFVSLIFGLSHTLPSTFGPFMGAPVHEWWLPESFQEWVPE